MATYEQQIASIPSDPAGAWNYATLLALWKEQSARVETTPEDLAAWDQRVLECLHHSERRTYLDETILQSGSVAGGKLNRLTRILLGRHPQLSATTG